MAKPKQFTKPPKKQKSKAQAPETASDFQKAADAEEDTGGKWRGGDPAKSCRAFVRALYIYDNGIQRYPKNFDLAYNRARLQLEITQQPALVEHFPVPLMDLLRQTLDSHRFALRLNEENADVLFNTAQVLTELAERLLDEVDRSSAVPLLHEALELLSVCLSRQEMMYEQQQAEFQEADGGSDIGGVPLELGERASSTSGESVSEQSVLIESPLMPSDLLETVHASLTALTLLLDLISPTDLQTLGDMAQSLTEKKAPAYLNQMSAEDQRPAISALALARASFIASYADAEYRAGGIDAGTYAERVECFKSDDIAKTQAALCEHAEVLTGLVRSATAWSSGSSGLSLAQTWTILSLANDLYGQAIKAGSSDSTDRRGNIYSARSDVEMLRFRVATGGNDNMAISESIKKSAATLVKNAQTYYKGAAAFFRTAGDEKEHLNALEKYHIAVKISRVVAGNVSGALEDERTPVTIPEAKRAHGVVEEMLEDGLLGEYWARFLLPSSE